MKSNIKRIELVFCTVMALGMSTFAWAVGDQAKSKNPLSGVMGTSQEDIQKHANDRSTVLTFDKGVSALSADNQQKIRDLVTAIGMENITRVEVAAWSDKEFPKKGADLAKADRDLADQRVSKINDFLKTDLNFSALDIKTFNMAETSNWLARAIRTDEAELKSIFSKEAMAPMARADFNVIAREGAPMKAVIVFVRK